MEASEIYTSIYDSVIEKLNSGFLLNIKAVKWEIRSLTKRINVLVAGANFASCIEEVERVEEKLEYLREERRAYLDILSYVNKKIKESKL